MMMIGRSKSIAAKAAEADLQKRIKSLQEELNEAKKSLQCLRKTGEIPQSESSALVQTLHGNVSKKGYLFKWQDRNIGWGGTKWALRFVELKDCRIRYYASHTEEQTPRYELILRGCAVKDEGWKRNRRHHSKEKEPPLNEAGAYFFIFSIYQRSEALAMSDHDTDEDIVPLLRLSTPSLAEKSQWIQLISEACAYAMTDDFLVDEEQRAAELKLQQAEAAKMALAMPEAKEGTLPPLYFAPAHKPLVRRPSMSKTMADASKFQTKSIAKGEKVDSRINYPPSKPMHRASAPSYLSDDAPAQNYRGLFNLGVLILVVSNFRLILGTVRTHGFVLSKGLVHLLEWQQIMNDPWEQFPMVSGFLLQIVFIVIAYAIEWALSRKKLTESLGMSLHYLNAISALVIPCFIVWNFIDKPAVGGAILLHATINNMKLISYAAANEDYRKAVDIKGSEARSLTLGIVEDLDPEDANIVYPENVTWRNLIYFCCAPTLTYQIAFPRSPRIRWYKVAIYILRILVAVTLFVFLIAQVVAPNLDHLIRDLEATNGQYTASIFSEYLLRLAIANTYLWLIMFYTYFHLYMNLLAELLRFGDRVFYKDWWNSAEVSAYWRLWNLPVHYWLVRHVYFPCLRLRLSRAAATFVVFFLSAVMHEVCISVPFHTMHPWGFLGMMAQMPLVAFTKYLYRRYPGSSIGNIIFWLAFCLVGQPTAILLYTVDYQYGKHHDSTVLDDPVCRIMWQDRCLVR